MSLTAIIGVVLLLFGLVLWLALHLFPLGAILAAVGAVLLIVGYGPRVYRR